MEHNLISFCHQRILHADQCGGDYDAICRRTWERFMTSNQREQLNQLVTRGPIWDGDVISKEARDDLLHSGLASRACVAGEQGYTVANYRGFDVWKIGQITGS